MKLSLIIALLACFGISSAAFGDQMQSSMSAPSHRAVVSKAKKKKAKKHTKKKAKKHAKKKRAQPKPAELAPTESPDSGAEAPAAPADPIEGGASQ